MSTAGALPAVLLCLLALLGSGARPVAADEGVARAPDVQWSFDGVFGRYDRNALRRGFRVYEEVCASCHGLKYLSYRNLGEDGGPEFTPEEVRALAARFTVEDGPDSYGDMFERSALPSDRFAEPFPNEEAARAANGGALPPDLSLIVKADPGGADHIHALLIGYADPPEGVELTAGQYYNRYAADGVIAMPPPLAEGIVDYTDDTPETVDQMARDVTHFLAWAAEPRMEQRKRLGFQVMVFLIVLAGMLWLATRKVWSREH